MVVFENEGEIDVRAITTFGVSVKDEGAIGYFGTGLKMAISVILRNGGSITVYSGEAKYEFSTKTETVRGKDFDFIYMNDVQLGFTTSNARTWEMWMAVREIYCNCIDEGGISSVDDDVSPSEGKTCIIVECPDFEREYNSRGDFILSGKRLLWANNELEVYAGATDKLFYKGVRVYESNKPYCFTYNILSRQSLTEDRTISNTWSTHWDIAKNIVGCDLKPIINTVFLCGDSYTEYGFNFNQTFEISNCLRSLIDKHIGKINDRIPPDIMKNFSPSIRESLPSVPEITLDTVDSSMLATAVEFLTNVGIYSDKYSVKIVESLGDGVYGCVLDDTIYLSQLAFRNGTKFLAETLYEEYIHLNYKVSDYTREFQDTVISDLISIAQKLVGKPL